MNLRGSEEPGRRWRGQTEGYSIALMYKILKYTNKMNVKMCDIWETEGGES